jgi:hypothetical protein
VFRVPDGDGHPGDAFSRLVASCPELAHLRDGEPRVEWLFKLAPTIRNGREVLGTVYMPSVQGQLKPLFEWFMEKEWGAIPDYLVVLDDGYWERATDRQREILVFHEACHMVQKCDQFGVPMFDKETGVPKWGLSGHDVEEFSSVVRRYGAHNADIALFLAAAKEGGS